MPESEQIEIILFSNPGSIPDRTALLLAGREQELTAPLNDNVRTLISLGCSHVVICCFTFHAMLHTLEKDLRKKVVSLSEYTKQEIFPSYTDKKILILCTKGSARYKLFGEDENVMYSTPEDQQFVHQCIYRLKEGVPVKEVVLDLKGMLKKYQFDNMVMGCTDLYLITNDLIEAFGEEVIIDPLRVMTYDITNSWKKQIAARNK
jgi:aspartate/glutamate racemase